MISAALWTFLFVNVASAAPKWPDAGAPLSLEQCFDAAVAQSELIGTQNELIVQAEERYRQATGSVLPTVNANASYLVQETPSSSLGGSFSPSTQPVVRFSATQPLFRGFREFAGLRQAKGLLGAQQFARQQALIQLYKDVAQVFYTVIALEQDLLNIASEMSYYRERVRELNERKKIGRSRASEVLSVQSAIANLKAQSEQIRGQLWSARESFRFLTGRDHETPLADAEPPVPVSGPLPDISAFIKLSEQRPDIKAELEREKATYEGIAIARGAHLPSVDLNGDYFLIRSGSLKDVNWDAQIALSLPIYAGGVIQSRVREAASLHRQEQLNLSRVRRTAEQEIRTQYEIFTADRAQLAALTEAVRIAHRNYRQQTEEYRLGLVTNIDVLQALTTFQESQRALDRARFSAQLDWVRLEASVARRPRSGDRPGG